MTIAVHLAAGQGTRLRPLTDDRPKPLVELGGTSLLERNVQTLRSAGIGDQIVVTGYMSERIEELGYDTVHNEDYDTTEMVHSLFRAKDRFPEDEDLIISYGDIIYHESIVDSLLNSTAPMSVVVDTEWEQLWNLRFDDPLDDAESLKLTADGLIREIGRDTAEIADIEAQYIGLIKVSADYVSDFVRMYERISDGGTESVEMTTYIQKLVDDGWDVEAVRTSGRWVEVDTTTDLKRYQNKIAKETDLQHLSWL